MTEQREDLIEYLATIVPGATVDCAGCPVKREVGAMVKREGKFYCSERCADIANAVVRKAQPKGVKINGWDV